MCVCVCARIHEPASGVVAMSPRTFISCRRTYTYVQWLSVLRLATAAARLTLQSVVASYAAAAAAATCTKLSDS